MHVESYKRPRSLVGQVQRFNKVLQTPPQRGTKDRTKHFLPGWDGISPADLFFAPTLWAATTPYKHLPLDGICVTWSMQTKWTICANQKSCVHVNGAEMGQECCNWFRCDTHCRRELPLELQSEIPHYSTTWTGCDVPRLITSQLIKCDLAVCLNYTSSLITRPFPTRNSFPHRLCSGSNWS